MPEAITVGRIVHYVSRETSSPCQAAIVTQIVDLELASMVRLTVFLPAGKNATLTVDAKFSLDNEPGTWHWPERAQ